MCSMFAGCRANTSLHTCISMQPILATHVILLLAAVSGRTWSWQQLGFEPFCGWAFSTDVVSSCLSFQVNHDAIGKIIMGCAIGVPFPAQGWPLSSSTVGTIPLRQLSDVLHSTSHQWTTATWAKTAHEAHHQARQAVQQAFSGSGQAHASILTAILPEIAAIFTRDSSLKLKRFSALKAKLYGEVVPALFKEAVEACKPDIQEALSHARREQSRKNPPSQPAPYCALVESITSFLRQELVVRLGHVEDLLAKAGPAKAWLQENEFTKQQRARIEANCSSITRAQNIIECIEQANLQKAAQPPPRRRAKRQGPLLW